MLTKRFNVTRLVLLFALLVAPGLASVAGADDNWTQLDPGDQHWYTLDYTGHHDFVKADDEDEEDKAIWVSSNIDVRMDVEPDGGAGFQIVTPEQVAAWVAGEDLEGCGCGTENDYDPSDLNWSGGFGEPGTYYLVVNYTGNGTDPVFYSLSISGQDVAYQTPEADGEETAQPSSTGQPISVEAAAPQVVGGTGPGDAMAPTGAWVSLPPGETLWYAFDYQGHHRFPKVKEDEEKEDPIWIASQVDVWLDSEPDESVTFSVWSEDQVQVWLAGGEFEPLGKGTPSDYDPGDLNWAGSFGGPGRYYVVLKNESPTEATFLLSVSGEDITF